MIFRITQNRNFPSQNFWYHLRIGKHSHEKCRVYILVHKKVDAAKQTFFKVGNDPKRNFEKEGTLFRKNKEPKIYSSER